MLACSHGTPVVGLDVLFAVDSGNAAGRFEAAEMAPAMQRLC